MSTLARHTDHAAARLLRTCRRSGTLTDALPPELRPNDPATGHAIQASLPEPAGLAVVGGKIAAISAAGQVHRQVDGPLAGRILEGFLDPVVASLTLAGKRMRGACAWEGQSPSSMPERGLGT